MSTRKLPSPYGACGLQAVVHLVYTVLLLGPGDCVFADRPVFAVAPRPLSVSRGGSATFDCVATGSPNPSVSWTDSNNDVIINQGRFTIYPNNSLTISDVQDSDAGFVTCHATNSFGTNVASAALNVFSAARPVFTRTPEDKTVNLGLSVIFICEASGSPDPVLSWRKEGGELPAGRTEFISSGWMRILDIQQLDAGRYVCHAENSVGSVMSSASLTVHVGPTFTETPADQTCSLSQTISFSCRAAGIPTPHITWTTPHSGTFPAPTSQVGPSGIAVSADGTLTITTVRGVDEGEYRCLATNAVGTATISSTLDVQYAPSFTHLPVDTQALIHESPLLLCQATGDPAPYITWVFQGSAVTDGPKYDISTSGNLQVTGITKADEGVYLCRAENTLGSVEQGAYLTVRSLPVFTVTPPVETIVHIGQHLQLDCQAIGDPTPTVEWMKDNTALVQSNVQLLSNGTLVISDINEGNLGSYVCIAYNDAGSHQAPANVWLPDVPIFTTLPSNRTINITQSIHVPCRASARDTPTISWYRPGSAGNSEHLIGQGVGQALSENHRSVSVSLVGTLIITNVREDEEGFYICRAANAVGEVETLLYLDVKIPPTDVTSNSPQVVMENDTATLNCSSNSDPPATVSWFHPSGLPVTPNDGRFSVFENSLQVSSANADDAGSYQCVLRNMLGSAQADVQLTVHGPPKLTSLVSMVVEETLRLACVAIGSPSPVVSWWNGAVRIVGTATPGLVVDENSDLFIAHVGLGNYIQSSDVFYCKVTNMFGQDQYKLTRPCSPSKPTVIDATAENVTLMWRHEDCSDVPSSSFTVQYQTVGNSNWVLDKEVVRPPHTIADLDAYTVYSFRVRANNALGAGNYSDITDQIQTLQDVPSPPSSVRVAVSLNVVAVRWTSPAHLNGPTQNIQYQISYQEVNGNSPEMTVAHSHQMPLEESLILEHGMTYRIRVRAGNTDINRWSSWVPVTAVTPHLPPSAPPTITYATPVSRDSILVKWLASTDDFFLGFLVSFREVGMSTYTTYRLPDPQLARYTIEGLDIEVEHDVKVAAYNEGGDGPYSTVRRVSIWVEEETTPVANKSLPTGVVLAIVGGAVGLLLLIFVITCVVIVQRKRQFKHGQRHSLSTDQLWEGRGQHPSDVFETGSMQSGRSGVQGNDDVTAFVNESFQPGINEETTNVLDAMVRPIGARDHRDTEVKVRRQPENTADVIEVHGAEGSSPTIPTLNIIEEEPSISTSLSEEQKSSSGRASTNPVSSSGPGNTDDQILQISFDIPEASDDDNQDTPENPPHHDYMEIDDNMSDLNNLNLPQHSSPQVNPIYAKVNKDVKLQRKLQKEREEMAKLAAKAEEKRRREAEKLIQKGSIGAGSARSRRRRRKLKAAEQAMDKQKQDQWGVNLERRKKDSESAGLF